MQSTSAVTNRGPIEASVLPPDAQPAQHAQSCQLRNRTLPRTALRRGWGTPSLDEFGLTATGALPGSAEAPRAPPKPEAAPVTVERSTARAAMPTAIETAWNGAVGLCAFGTPKALALATPKRDGPEPRIAPDFFSQVIALAPRVVGPLQGMRSQIHRIGRQTLGGAQHAALHPLVAKAVVRTATAL